MNAQVVAAAGFLLAMLLFGLMWLLAAAVHLQRRVSLHWSAAMLLPGSAAGLMLAREVVPPHAGWLAANLLLGLGLLSMRRGVDLFVRRPPADREAVLLVVLLVVAIATAAVTGRSWVAVAGTSAVCGIALLRSGASVATHLAGEFGTLSARLCALPLAGIGLLLAIRSVGALVSPDLFGQGVHVGRPFNVWLLTAMSAVVTVLNVGLAALVVLRLVRRLEHRNAHDPLTEVLNRRGLDTALALQARRHRRQGRGWAVLAVDIDHFKRVNDQHGHAAGDAVLTRVAQALAAVVRPVDRVGRAGGEEFVVLLPATDAAAAQAVAERMRAAVGDLHHPEIGRPGRVTVSVGVAVVSPADDEPPAAVLRRADRALYEAKAAGRDRVVLAVGRPDAPATAAEPRYG